jgi:hypothetical protein
VRMVAAWSRATQASSHDLARFPIAIDFARMRRPHA